MISPQGRAMDLLNDISGCECQRVSLSGNLLSGRMMGWGPSLHRTGLTWSITPEDPTDAGCVSRALAPVAALQRRRISRALQLGLAGNRQPDAGHLGHLRTDTVVLALESGIPAIARRMFARLNQRSDDALAQTIRLTDIVVSDGTDEDPRPRLLHLSAIDHGEYDGETLSIFAHLPDTVLAALPGRRVGDVVGASMLEPELQPVLDREILSAYGGEPNPDASFNLPLANLNLVTTPDWTDVVNAYGSVNTVRPHPATRR